MSLSTRLWKARMRGRASELRHRLARPAPVPKLSVAIIAQDCERELAGLLANVRELAAEIVVVDGGSKDGTADLVRAEPKGRLIERPWDGHFGRQKNAALAACTGDWILHLDCDERVGPNLAAWLPRLCAARRPIGYRLPMYWLTAERPAQYVLSPKHYPCHCPRLLRNLPEMRYEERSPVHVTLPKDVVRRMTKVHGAHLFHYCFLWRTREELRVKAERYLRDHPGSEVTTMQTYLYWTAPHEIRSCDEQPWREVEA